MLMEKRIKKMISLFIHKRRKTGKEYIRCVIDEELLAIEIGTWLLFMQLSIVHFRIYKRTFIWKDLCDIEIWMNDTEVQYDLPKYSLGGYLMCSLQKKEIEKIRNGSWDS